MGLGLGLGRRMETVMRIMDAEMGRRRGTRVRALGDYIIVRRWMSCAPLSNPPAPLFVSRYEETWFDARLEVARRRPEVIAWATR